nr:MAG TPA: hypothetical protein [Caudoviricetes sp.]
MQLLFSLYRYFMLITHFLIVYSLKLPLPLKIS